MLVEVLALLIFMAMTFAFVLRDDALATNPWKQRYDAIAQQLAHERAENARLQSRLAELERANRQLLRRYEGPIPANDALVITRDQWQELIDRLANAEAVVESQQSDIRNLQERLSGNGGTDLPNCTVSPTSFIVRIYLSGGGYRAVSSWPASSNQAVANVPGLAALGSGRTLSQGEFVSLSQQVRAWGRAQPVPCAFRAEVFPQHSSMDLYRRQQSAINGAFYARYH